MVIRGLSGFGDAIYLEPLARKCSEQNNVTVLTNYPDVFAHLPVKISKFTKSCNVDRDFSYIDGKSNPDSTQLTDMGYANAEDFTIEHAPIAILAAGYDGMGSRSEMTPNKKVLQGIINELCERGYKVLHIANNSKEKYSHVTEIISQNYFETVALFKGADLIVCQQGWGTALAEGLNKLCLIVFADTIRKSALPFIRQITPQKVCCKKTTRFVWDSEYQGLDNAFARKVD